MSRVTPPVTKLSHAVRSLSSTTTRPSGLHALPLKSSELTVDAHNRQSRRAPSNHHELDHDARPFHTLPSHRPTAPSSKPHTIPLMQGFRTTAPKPSATPTTMDFITLPPPPSGPPTNPFSKLRVPLLPDNYTPDRSASSAHAVEAQDEAVAGAEIHVVAAHRDVVAALSEVVGNDAVEREWGTEFAGREKEASEPGVLRELWGGFVEDIFGKKGKAPKMAV